MTHPQHRYSVVQWRKHKYSTLQHAIRDNDRDRVLVYADQQSYLKPIVCELNRIEAARRILDKVNLLARAEL